MDQRISTQNARFQQWQALLGNRNKRQRAGEFLVQGVRPITLAVRHGWPLRALLYDAERRLSRWAEELLDGASATRYALAPELMAELGEKDAAAPDGGGKGPELLAVAEMLPDEPRRVPVPERFLGVLVDRPTSPGNLGSIIRSADAFGAHGVVVTGHAADVYDPKTVRASTGSLFALPTVRAASPATVTDWLGGRAKLVGTDEHGTADIDAVDLTGPTLLLVGNETSGLSAGWRERCDALVRIPISGAASSLNAATAATVALYEAARQRR